MRDRDVGRILVERRLMRADEVQAALSLLAQLQQQGRPLTLADLLVASKRISVTALKAAVPGLEVVNRMATTAQEDPEETVEDLERVGRYVIMRQLGEGAMGTVYMAKDPEQRRIVAVKVLKKVPPTTRKRFAREAKAISKLQHPNIVSIYEIVTEGSTPYFVMELVEGRTLSQMIALEASCDEVLEVLEQVAHAVGYAHGQGVLHRDLKPSNVVVEPGGRAVVLDFGLARLMDDTGTQLTVMGETLGTPLYMSPEQAMGSSDIGPASDLFSLGVMLYEGVTGRVPFQGDSVLQLVVQITTVDPPPPSQVAATPLPPGVDAVCMRCLSKDPEQRYPSATVLAHSLKGLRAASKKPSWQTGLLPVCLIGGCFVFGLALVVVGIAVAVYLGNAPS